MTDVTDLDLRHPRRYVRLDTILRLRWLAALGQLAAIFIVEQGLSFDLPSIPCIIIISASALLNLVLQTVFNPMQRLEPAYAAALLALNIAELAGLLFLTGGLQNPFSYLFLAPVLISATALPTKLTVWLGVFAALCATALGFFYLPLPWDADDMLVLPPIYLVGVWLSILLTLVVVGGIIGLISRELEKANPETGPFTDDLKTLREQAQRCREILGKITQLSSSGAPFDRMPLTTLIEEAVAPHRDFGIAIKVRIAVAGAAEPVLMRNPAILYGVGNLLENAVDFARSSVEVNAWWNSETVEIVISDDGPGIPPDILKRIGEPYLTRRRGAEETGEHRGLGLGVFIARTLLERSDAKVSFSNRTFPDHGAVVQIAWPRASFETANGPDVG